MKQRIQFLALGYLFLTSFQLPAQYLAPPPPFLYCEVREPLKTSIINSLNSFLAGIQEGKPDSNFIDKTNYALNRSVFNSFKDHERIDSISAPFKNQLINLYPVSTNEYFISLSCTGMSADKTPVVISIFNLIATNDNGKIRFSIPLNYLTKNWKTKTIGLITYHYPNVMNSETAEKFNERNLKIANKLGQKPERFHFYLCENYPEILKLMGYAFDAGSSGKYRDGYGVDANTIFSIMNSEDFSHDLFHYYSSKLRKGAPGNRTVEEGIAYSWGNAYYTKTNGDMIEQKELVHQLAAYLQKNPKASLLSLFTDNTNLFTQLPPEVSVKSTISSLLCDEVERKKGVDGIRMLILCGKGDDRFFKTLDELVGINQLNFDQKTKALIEAYQ
jgi:hypothetical protein